MKHALLAAVSLSLSLSTATAQRPQADVEFVRDGDVKLKSFAELSYPRVALAARVEGAVVVRIALDDQGAVTSSTALSGHPMLVPDAVGNSKRWSFVAGSSRTAILVYLFEIEGTCSGYRSLFRIGNQPNIALVSACGSWVLPL